MHAGRWLTLCKGPSHNVLIKVWSWRGGGVFSLFSKQCGILVIYTVICRPIALKTLDFFKRFTPHLHFFSNFQ